MVEKIISLVLKIPNIVTISKQECSLRNIKINEKLIFEVSLSLSLKLFFICNQYVYHSSRKFDAQAQHIKECEKSVHFNYYM